MTFLLRGLLRLGGDGTTVVTHANGQVCILKLHLGQRRVSYAEFEEILASQKLTAK